MIEKQDPTYLKYQKKIVPYLDGSLEPQDKSEFEAFVSTHPDFEKLVKERESEIIRLQKMIPSMDPSEDSRESLQTEMKASVDNLFEEVPQGRWKNLKLKIEDWLNR